MDLQELTDLEAGLNEGKCMKIKAHDERLLLCAAYGKYVLIGQTEKETKRFDDFHELCVRLDLFKPYESRLIGVAS